MPPYALRLFVAGDSPSGVRAKLNLERLCAEHLAGGCDVTVVDVLKDPEQAEAYQVLATPTLIKVSPPPHRRVLGDLGNIETVIAALNLRSTVDGKEGSTS